MRLLMPVDLTVDVSISRTDASKGLWVGVYPAIPQRERGYVMTLPGSSQSRLNLAAAAGLRWNEA